MTDSDEDSPSEESTRDAADRPPGEDPTIACHRCGREWTLTYELETLQVGNQAVEQFALDHKRHTGHFPDDVSTWQACCQHCPERVDRLSERPARRWARTHARHTDHAVELRHVSLSDALVIENESR